MEEEHSTTRVQWRRSLGISRAAELAWSRPSLLVVLSLSLSLSLCSKMSSFCVWFPRKENGGRFSNSSVLYCFECIFLLSFLVLGTCALFLVSAVVCSGI
jgi:hypothetical protein